MHAKSYLPTQEAELTTWTSNLISVSKTYKTLLGIPDERITELETPFTQFKTLYEKCQTATYTKVDMEQKNISKKIMCKKITDFVRFHLQNNEKMTDDMRVEFQIPIYDTHHTKHPSPESIPEIEIKMPYPRTLHIRFKAENALRWGKPQHVHGIECLWVIADSPPSKIEDELLHSMFATKNPLELTFDEEKRGKKVYFALRWENGTVKKGPWSDIFSAIIP